MSELLLSLIILAGASGPSVSMKTKVSVRQTTGSPSFHPMQRPLLMDRGNLVNLGRGLFAEQENFFFLDTRTLKTFTVRAPIAAFLARHPDLFPGAEGAGWPKYATNRLLFYDTQDKRAGILYNDARGYKRRLFFLLWDLEQNAITRVDQLGAGDLNGRWFDVLPLRYDPELRQGLVRKLTMERATKMMPSTVAIMTLGTREPRTIASVKLKRSLRDPPHFDLALRRVMLTEYAENPVTGRGPVGYLVDLDRGTIVECDIPVTAYSVAFGPKGKTVYALSNQTGELWAIDAKTGKLLQKRKHGKRGHALGMIAPGTLLMLNNKGYHFINAKTLKRRKFLPYKTKNLGSGPHLIERSFIVPGRAYVWEDWALHVMDIRMK